MVESEGDEVLLCADLAVDEVATVFPGVDAVVTDGTTCYYLAGEDEQVGEDVDVRPGEAAAAAELALEVTQNGPEYSGPGCEVATVAGADEGAACGTELLLQVGPIVFILLDFAESTDPAALTTLAQLVAARA